MAITKIIFDHNGENLSIELSYKGLIAASYTYTLWEADSNDIVEQKKGNNLNSMDDKYTLPSPVSSNSGRLVDIHSTIHGLYDNADEGEFMIIITIKQGDQAISQIEFPENKTIIGTHTIAHQHYILLL